VGTRVLSIRIKEELLVEARKLGINIRETIEEALKREIEEQRRKQLEKAISEGLESLKEVDEKEWIRTIKEIRHER